MRGSNGVAASASEGRERYGHDGHECRHQGDGEHVPPGGQGLRGDRAGCEGTEGVGQVRLFCPQMSGDRGEDALLSDRQTCLRPSGGS